MDSNFSMKVVQVSEEQIEEKTKEYIKNWMSYETEIQKRQEEIKEYRDSFKEWEKDFFDNNTEMKDSKKELKQTIQILKKNLDYEMISRMAKVMETSVNFD